MRLLSLLAAIGKSTSHDFPFIDVGMIGHALVVPLLVIPSSNTPSVNRHAVGDNTEIVVRKKGPCRAHLFSQKGVEVSNLSGKLLACRSQSQCSYATHQTTLEEETLNGCEV